MRIDPGSAVPIYQQIINEIQAAIAAGIFVEGERIPSARELAIELKVNPNTVQKAYLELTQLLVIESRRGLGRFVRKRGVDSAIRQSEEAISDVFAKGIQIGRAARLSDRRIKQLFNAAMSAAGREEVVR